MGTTREWLSVVIWGGFYGGMMAWWLARSDRAPAMLKPKGRLARIEHGRVMGARGSALRNHDYVSLATGNAEATGFCHSRGTCGGVSHGPDCSSEARCCS